MTVHRKPRVLLQQCTAPGCPFLTRHKLCPLHRPATTKETSE